MKCQSLLPGENNNKKKSSVCRLLNSQAELAQRVVKFKIGAVHIHFYIILEC